MIKRVAWPSGQAQDRSADEDGFQGILIADGRRVPEDGRGPRISAFIWGGKVRPSPTLPYGRWKGAA